MEKGANPRRHRSSLKVIIHMLSANSAIIYTARRHLEKPRVNHCPEKS